ncbi:MAG: HEPN domain-containing protein [Candidatus Aminicenantes bacterium]|nr:HEPN domain-containing protein [Candidatus Aminicenantes bacterium]
MREEIKEIIKYRIEQAEDALKDAVLLFDSGGGLRSVINRSYYVMFYATLALIAAKGMGSSKHSNAISIFDKEYVKTGYFSKEMSKLLHKAFNLRVESDYKEFNIISRDETLIILEGAKFFLERIKTFLNPLV